MAKYEVIVGIYKSGEDESLEEGVLFETNDLSEAEEFLAQLSEDEDEDASEEVEEEQEEVE